MRRKALFYLLLAAATLSLSAFFGAWRGWRAAPSASTGVLVAVYALAVAGAMLWLGFLLYEVDRAAGRVRHRIWLYEWALTRKAGARDEWSWRAKRSVQTGAQIEPSTAAVGPRATERSLQIRR
jgi:hypothetical protein